MTYISTSIAILLGLILVYFIYQNKKAKNKSLIEIDKKKNEIHNLIGENTVLRNDNKRLDELEIIKKEVIIYKSEIEKKNSIIKNLENDFKKYSDLISIEKKITEEQNKLNSLNQNLNELNIKYTKSKTIYDNLISEIKLYQEDIDLINYGVYERMYEFETSEKYALKLLEVKEKQKQLFKEDKAITSNVDEIYYTSKYSFLTSSYRKSINNYKKIISNAFNNEADKLIAKVKWNNINASIEKIKNLGFKINNYSRDFCGFLLLQNSLITGNYSSNNFEERYNNHMIVISNELINLKIEEIKLRHEYLLKKQEEKEELKEIRARIREEERAQREFEKAKKEAELEEMRFQKALERAQKELGLVKGEELEKLHTQITELQKNLQEAHEAKERAISRAQETKSGHVYIISNIGSFGENIYKIGMTRRLEPMDRVKELGDASVPFRFDLHALIYTKNAPELENLLQKEFDDRRINKVNSRKEYFRVTLDEIEQVIKEKYDKEVEFFKVPEAQEYRETKSIIKQLEQAKQEQIENEIEKYPDSLF